jgi:transposase InsO family protein
LSCFRAQQISASAAIEELQIGRARFYELYSQYLKACGKGEADTWIPGLSGGAHQPAWPEEVTALARKLLSSKPPSPYNAIASELLRRCQFKTDRASIRRWAMAHQLAPDTRYKKAPTPVKRWQARDLGALWQYDASPHLWLTLQPQKHALLNLLDDATRYNVSARLYPSETLLAHFDFLDRAFRAHGLPLALYVDYHSFFFTHTPDAFTQLGAALHFYGVALRYAPTPQAKGKIERRHHYYQGRLPALFAAENIIDLSAANALLDQLLPHANAHEVHRELGLTPKTAWAQAVQENRSVLRPAPACPWWPYVFSQRSSLRVGDDGKVPVGHQRFSVSAPPRSSVIRCLRPDGDTFFLRHAPDPKKLPAILLHSPVF